MEQIGQVLLTHVVACVEKQTKPLEQIITGLQEEMASIRSSMAQMQQEVQKLMQRISEKTHDQQVLTESVSNDVQMLTQRIQCETKDQQELCKAITELTQNFQSVKSSINPEQLQREMRQADVKIDKIQHDIQELKSIQTAGDVKVDKISSIVSQISQDLQPAATWNRQLSTMEPIGLPRPNLLRNYPGPVNQWTTGMSEHLQFASPQTFASLRHWPWPSK